MQSPCLFSFFPIIYTFLNKTDQFVITVQTTAAFLTKNNWGIFLQNFLVKIDPALTLYHEGFIQIQLNSQKFCQFKIYKNVY